MWIDDAIAWKLLSELFHRKGNVLKKQNIFPPEAETNGDTIRIDLILGKSVSKKIYLSFYRYLIER